jgi:CxxC-x17-CxxC domain-containing protein
MWPAVCANCGEKIQVPFEPDPNRKTYCKECLKKTREDFKKNEPTDNNSGGSIGLNEAFKKDPVYFSKKKKLN